MTELLLVLVCSNVEYGRWSRNEFTVKLKSIGRQVCNIESLLESRVGYEFNLGPLVVPFTAPMLNEVGISSTPKYKIASTYTLSFNCIESQDQVISVRQLSTSICFAFQWYCGNLTNECSFTYTSSSVKCQFYWNWMLSSFKPRKKTKKQKNTKCSLHLLKKW